MLATRRKLLCFLLPLLHHRHFSSPSSSQIPTLYSFLQPTIFSVPKTPKPQPPNPSSPSPHHPNPYKTLDPSTLESHLLTSLSSHSTDDAWAAFKSLTSTPDPHLPSPSSISSLISHLCSLHNRLGLKRAFAAAIYLLDKDPDSLPDSAIECLFSSLAAPAPAPALALARKLLNARRLVPSGLWVPHLTGLCLRPDAFEAFLEVFMENCRIAVEEKAEAMRPDAASFNAVLEGCCKELGSVVDAERVLEMMTAVRVGPDVDSFGFLAFLYAWRGVERRVVELDELMDALGLEKKGFFKSLISGYVKACRFGLVSAVILRSVRERRDGVVNALDSESYVEIVSCFLENGRIKELAALIIQAQEIESEKQLVGVDSSVGFGIVNACVELGLLEKADSLLEEMTAQGAAVGLGVYSSIVKAYCKEQRTAEAAQLVAEISAVGLRLDAASYDALIDASMTAQDFRSAFSLFKEMREARFPELRMSYLTIMTGLMENNKPELMASFLDSVVDDPRIEIATHDWNSIIHAFSKLGRLEDARRMYRRMVFLRFEPNNQTYLSLINGYVLAEKYFSVLLLWTEVRRKGADFNHDLIDAFLYALVKGGFFDMAMQVIEKAQELKIFVNKWRHKQAFMETHNKLKVAKLRKRSYRKMEALIAFKNWAGLNA